MHMQQQMCKQRPGRQTSGLCCCGQSTGECCAHCGPKQLAVSLRLCVQTLKLWCAHSATSCTQVIAAYEKAGDCIPNHTWLQRKLLHFTHG
jgi:hypothetical protein